MPNLAPMDQSVDGEPQDQQEDTQEHDIEGIEEILADSDSA